MARSVDKYVSKLEKQNESLREALANSEKEKDDLKFITPMVISADTFQVFVKAKKWEDLDTECMRGILSGLIDDAITEQFFQKHKKEAQKNLNLLFWGVGNLPQYYHNKKKNAVRDFIEIKPVVSEFSREPGSKATVFSYKKYKVLLRAFPIHIIEPDGSS